MSEMNNAVEILQASIFDLDKLIPLFDAYRVFYKQKNSDLPAIRQFLQDRLRNLDSVIFCASRIPANEKEDCVGFCQLYPSFSSVSMRRIWILNDLFVSPSARNLGIGEKLIRQAIAFAKATEAKKLVLQTGKDNKTAQKLYSRLEWVRNEEFLTYEFTL